MKLLSVFLQNFLYPVCSDKTNRIDVGFWYDNPVICIIFADIKAKLFE